MKVAYLNPLMKYFWPAIFALATDCQAHLARRGARVHAVGRADSGEELGAAKIIHGIRGAEQALAKDLRGDPKFLISEERLLHRASQFALRGGRLRSRQLRTLKKLDQKERAMRASFIQHKEASGSEKVEALAHQEAHLVQHGRGILHKVHDLKSKLEKDHGKNVNKFKLLLERVDGGQKEIMSSEAEAAAHVSKLAAAIRQQEGKRRPSVAGAFAQGRTRAVRGTKDPVRRAKVAKQALGQLATAKSEVAAAFGADDETAKKVESMIDQLQGSMQGLETESEEDTKSDFLAKVEEEAKQKKAGRMRGGSFAQSAKDPVHRAKVAKQALGQLATAKSEVAAAFGADDETAKKVESMIDQLQGSMQGLETESEEDAKSDFLAKVAKEAKQKKAGRMRGGSFAQVQGTKDPARRVKVAKQALGQLAAAKSEVMTAYGTDDATAQQVEAMIDQVQGSMQGLEEGFEQDAKSTFLTNIEQDAERKHAGKKLAVSVGAFAQADNRLVQGTKDPVRRAKLAKQALGQLAAAKKEVAEVYDDNTAQKVESMIDQLQTSMQGLETASEKASLAQASASTPRDPLKDLADELAHL